MTSQKNSFSPSPNYPKVYNANSNLQVSGGISRDPPSNSYVTSSGGGSQQKTYRELYLRGEISASAMDDNLSEKTDWGIKESTNVGGEKSSNQKAQLSADETMRSLPLDHPKSTSSNHESLVSQKPASQGFQTSSNYSVNFQSSAAALKRESSSSNLNHRVNTYSSPALTGNMQKIMQNAGQRPTIVPQQNQPLPQQRPIIQQQLPPRTPSVNPINYPPSPVLRANSQNFSSPRPPLLNQRSGSSYPSTIRPTTNPPQNYVSRMPSEPTQRVSLINEGGPRLQLPVQIQNRSDDDDKPKIEPQESVTFEPKAKPPPSSASLITADSRQKIELPEADITPIRNAIPLNLIRLNNELQTSIASSKKETDFSNNILEEESDLESLDPTVNSPTITASSLELKNIAKDGSVFGNIKFFEEKDKAKIPLLPKSPSRESKENKKDVKPQRPADIIMRRNNDNDEPGVDETSVKHPNLRSINHPPQKVARINFSRDGKSSTLRRSLSVSSAKTNKKTVSIAPVHSTPQTPKKTLTPQDVLVGFFHSTVRKNRIFNSDDADHDSGVDEGKDNGPNTNGRVETPKTPAKSKRVSSSLSPVKTPVKSPGTPGKTAKTPELSLPSTPLIKKVPMNKIQVGSAPSPNIKAVKSKIGSLANTTYKPGGGNVRIENQKIDFSHAQSRISAKNAAYMPSGGDKKIPQVKLQWNAKSKIGSLENASYRPGGGDKKIESVKLDFKDKAKPKVGSKDNMKHIAGGGAVKNSNDITQRTAIESHKVEVKAQSKIGSLDNVKHKPGGGDVMIFNDRQYMKQVSATNSEGQPSGTQKECDLSVVSEVKSVEQPGTPAVKITKTTTISNPEIIHKTEVTVTNQPAKSLTKSPSKQEIKLTYSSVQAQSPKKQAIDHGPIEIMRVPAQEHAPILNPEVVDKDASLNNQSTLHSSSFSSKKDVLNEENINEDKTRAAKFIRDELATHAKVGEIWKEVHNISVTNGDSRTTTDRKPPAVTFKKPQQPNPPPINISTNQPQPQQSQPQPQQPQSQPSQPQQSQPQSQSQQQQQQQQQSMQPLIHPIRPQGIPQQPMIRPPMTFNQQQGNNLKKFDELGQNSSIQSNRSIISNNRDDRPLNLNPFGNNIIRPQSSEIPKQELG